MRTGLFGGTFSPVHNGHVAAMKAFKQVARLDRLTVMPTGTPPHKRFERSVSDADRLEMLKLAVGNIGEVSDYEMKKEGKSYTFETLEYLKSVFPSDELFLYMGSDMLLGFETVWRRTDEIMKLCTIVALSRTGDDLEKLESCAEHLRRDFGAKGEVFRIEPVVVSSSQIRALISEGKDVSDLVPKAVGEYIKQKGLYRGGENGDRCFGV